MRHDAAIILDLHFELIVWQHPLAEQKDFREPAGQQSMVRVSADVSLKQRRLCLSRHPTAIDKVFRDVTDLGDVGMRRDEIPVRQDKTGERVGMLFEERSEVTNFHGPIYIP